MANLRKPNPSSKPPAPTSPHSSPNPADAAGASDDDDLSLEAYEERSQPRPRLPERYDRSGQELAASKHPAPAKDRNSPEPGDDPFDTNPDGSGASGDLLASDDVFDGEIPDGSVHAAAETRPRPADTPRDTAPAKGSSSTMDDLEEFIARTAAQGPAVDRPVREKKALTLVEKVSFGIGGALLLGMVVFFFRAATSEAVTPPRGSDGWPKVPIKGSLVTITEASSNWRRRTDSDRVGQMDIILPYPGVRMPEIIPEVKVTIDSGASSDGYVRFLFRDSEGKPQGDTRVLGIKGGKLVDLGKGEIIKSGTEASIYASYGMVNLHAWNSYTGNDRPRWSVEVAESPNYEARDKDWKILGMFDVRDDLAK